MTKEKIIDGVEVEGCDYYYNGECRSLLDCTDYNVELFNRQLEINSNECKDNPNCYYKQFKRLEKENEKLKSLLDFEVQKREVLEQKIEDLNFYIDSYRVALEVNSYIHALEEIREKCKLYIDDKADLTPIQVVEIINEVLNDRN